MPTALITGGSRGIGAAAARQFAACGFDIAFTYRNKGRRAAAVAGELRARGVDALAQACDMTQPAAVGALLLAVAAWRPSLDALILNASGGLEADLVAQRPDYPMLINRDAQADFLEQALPLLARGATVVLVTSHWAHLYGRIAQLPVYEPVAASKFAGEHALRARLPDLAARGVRLLVVSGDVIEGTITPKLIERADPAVAAQHHAYPGTLPTADDMGRAIAAAVLDPALASGATVVVGRPLDEARG